MVGNHVTLPVCGRDVTFTLETVDAEMVERATMVWSGNERDQALLTQAALDDLIPSFLTSGQQNPAFGRKISGIIEVADGGRRRQTAIYTHSEYRVLVGDLDDEQMAWLSTIGNSYRQTSAYERGKRYARRLKMSLVTTSVSWPRRKISHGKSSCAASKQPNCREKSSHYSAIPMN